MSNCLVWRSSVPHKQFSHTRSAVTEYKGHLQLKRSTTERHIKTTLLCPTFKGRKTHSWRYDNDIDTEHEIETHHTSLAFYGYAHFSWSRALYVAVTWKIKFPCLNRPETKHISSSVANTQQNSVNTQIVIKLMLHRTGTYDFTVSFPLSSHYPNEKLEWSLETLITLLPRPK